QSRGADAPELGGKVAPRPCGKSTISAVFRTCFFNTIAKRRRWQPFLNTKQPQWVSSEHRCAVGGAAAVHWRPKYPLPSPQFPYRAADGANASVTLLAPGRKIAGGPDRDEPLRVELHVAARCQRAGLGSSAIPPSPGARRLRWTLLLSGTRPAGARCGRQRAVERDRAADRELSALPRRTGRFGRRALWPERDVERGRRRPRHHHGAAEESCRNHGCGHFRWSWPEVSDLGTRTLSRAARGGHREGARREAAVGFPGSGAGSARSTGMTMGSDNGSGGAGGPAGHTPGLGRAALEFVNVREGGVYIDGTFGAGGHSRLILAQADTRVIGIDRDATAMALGADLAQAAAGRLTLVRDDFS